jgi:hypothetical protein
MMDPAVVRLDGAWTVRREAEPPPLPREMKVGGRVREWGAGCEGDERAGKKEIPSRGAVPSGGRAMSGEATGAEVFTYQICSPVHSF